MVRRRSYTQVRRKDYVRPEHARGMGDVGFRGFGCPTPSCTAWIVVRDDELGPGFELSCEACGARYASGDLVRLYDYELVNTDEQRTIETGRFGYLIDDYLAEAERFKYCIVCGNLKPFAAFDQHSARVTGRQGECRLCKRTYNAIKNQTRLVDQHREAAQRRRLYVELSGAGKLDSAAVCTRYGYACFKCGKDLSAVGNEVERPLDHTLPAAYLWPLSTENATLLCRDHNGQKSGKWPAAFYTDRELRALAARTGIGYDLLAGPPAFNPDAVARLHDPAVVAGVLRRYAPYMDEVIALRNRLLGLVGFDFFELAADLSPTWVARADAELPNRRRPADRPAPDTLFE